MWRLGQLTKQDLQLSKFFLYNFLPGERFLPAAVLECYLQALAIRFPTGIHAAFTPAIRKVLTSIIIAGRVGNVSRSLPVWRDLRFLASVGLRIKSAISHRLASGVLKSLAVGIFGVTFGPVLT